MFREKWDGKLSERRTKFTHLEPIFVGCVRFSNIFEALSHRRVTRPHVVDAFW